MIKSFNYMISLVLIKFSSTLFNYSTDKNVPTNKVKTFHVFTLCPFCKKNKAGSEKTMLFVSILALKIQGKLSTSSYFRYILHSTDLQRDSVKNS